MRLLFLSSFFFFAVSQTLSATSWEPVGASGVSDGYSDYQSIVVDTAGMPVIAFSDGTRDGKITVASFDKKSSAWSVLGSAGFSDGMTAYNSLAIDKSGTIFVAFASMDFGAKTMVMKFDGSDWTVVGNPNFSNGYADSQSLVVGKDGTLYVVYRDKPQPSCDNNGTIMVMRYDDATPTWKAMGTTGFNGIPALALDRQDAPVVAYKDLNSDGKCSVQKYSDGEWKVQGVLGFSEGEIEQPSMVIDDEGTIFVAFIDVAKESKASVMKFSGKKWEYVGGQGISPSSIGSLSLMQTADKSLVVAFSDWSLEGKTTVMKLVDNKWKTVGEAGFSAGETNYVSLATADEDTLFVAYLDWSVDGKTTVMSYQESGDDDVVSDEDSDNNTVDEDATSDSDKYDADLLEDHDFSDNSDDSEYQDYDNDVDGSTGKSNGSACGVVLVF